MFGSRDNKERELKKKKKKTEGGREGINTNKKSVSPLTSGEATGHRVPHSVTPTYKMHWSPLLPRYGNKRA